MPELIGALQTGHSNNYCPFLQQVGMKLVPPLHSLRAGPVRATDPGSGRDEDSGITDEEPPESLERPLDPQLEELLYFAARIGGIGTLAVVLGQILHVDAFANFHWSGNDIIVGLWCAAPLLIYNSVALLAGRGRDKNVGYLLIEPKGLKRSASPASQDIAMQESDSAEMETIQSALRYYQFQTAMENITRGLNPFFELGVIVLNSLAAEMLYRAVIFTVLGYWIRDRLYEGGAEDFLWGSGIPTGEAAQWGTAFIFATFAVRDLIIKWQRATRWGVWIIGHVIHDIIFHVL